MSASATPSHAPGAGTGEAATRRPGAVRQVLYLHGFRSSPASFKARRMGAWLAAHRPDVAWACPALSPSPTVAWQQMQTMVADWRAAHPRLRATDDLAVVGSSLGGFYATALAEATGCRAVLLNPAIDPARDLATYVGRQAQFHAPDETFDFRAEYLDALRALAPVAITRPGRYAAVIAKGDELLCWTEMVGRYPGAAIRLLEGSDHALSDFDDHLPFVLAHLGLDSPGPAGPGR